MPATHNQTGRPFYDANGRLIRPGGVIGFDRDPAPEAPPVAPRQIEPAAPAGEPELSTEELERLTAPAAPPADLEPVSDPDPSPKAEKAKK